MKYGLAGVVVVLLLGIAVSTYLSLSAIQSLGPRINTQIEVHRLTSVTLNIVCKGVVIGTATYVQRPGETAEQFAERVRSEHAILTKTLCV